MQTLWIRAGAGKQKRDITLLHTLAHAYGPEFFSTLPAAHHLTGSDYLSKVGTKPAALKAHPEQYLIGFGSSKKFFKNL